MVLRDRSDPLLVTCRHDAESHLRFLLRCDWQPHQAGAPTPRGRVAGVAEGELLKKAREEKKPRKQVDLPNLSLLFIVVS
jgi:hypothetical protein